MRKIFILSTTLDPRYKLRTFFLQSTTIEAKRILISLITNGDTLVPVELVESQKKQDETFSGIWSACDSLIKEAEEEKPLSNMSSHPEQEEVESYTRCPNIPMKQDTKNYWSNEDKYPKLKMLAQKYLSYPMSSVASERLF